MTNTNPRQWRIVFYKLALKHVDPLELAYQLHNHNVSVVTYFDNVLYVTCDHARELSRFACDISNITSALAGVLAISRIETSLDGEWVTLDRYLQEHG